tara:strand:+ start:1943 stop:2122 length:180 start_codon:yes stop_codon:yes gene_type:complete
MNKELRLELALVEEDTRREERERHHHEGVLAASILREFDIEDMLLNTEPGIHEGYRIVN